MVEISIFDSVIQSFFIYLGIILVYNFIFSNTNIKRIIYSLILLLVLSLVGAILDDTTSLILVLGQLLRKSANQK
ncbi:Three-component quorum-sensing regulatorysystem sensor histidine kinase [Lactiplantibacillus plantarum]|nr:Three-component quorum-sensing regulatorysystem sensor histidine kinase [Lactiplantibacillus plantarum]KZU48584.1 Three-component quorum-sensing regulatorysystem sensor histidine kinase [Lactiplantibacillus plantarum]